MFKKITINLENGHKIIIEAQNNNQNNLFVQSIMYNGSTYDNNWLNHDDLLKGAVINFSMSNKPNKQRGILPKNFPYSLSTEK